MDLELCQRQGITLAMQTSMRILQLNNLQLRNYLGDLMTRNAVIELEYPDTIVGPAHLIDMARVRPVGCRIPLRRCPKIS